MHHVKLKQNLRFTPRKKGPLTPSRQAPLSRHHANYIAVSRITPWKKGLSRHHVMHHFRTITPIILLFHESRLEKNGQSCHHANHWGCLFNIWAASYYHFLQLKENYNSSSKPFILQTDLIPSKHFYFLKTYSWNNLIFQKYSVETGLEKTSCQQALISLIIYN